MQFARFLLGLLGNGPTAAAGFYAGAAWLNRYIGFTFPVGAPLLEDFRRPEAGHHPTPATALDPWEFFAFYSLAQTSEPTSVLYTMLVFAALACLRFEHLSISTRHSASSGFLRGYTPEESGSSKALGPDTCGASRGIGLPRRIP